MRDNGPITDTEILLPEGALLVSQTDPGGRITFANDAFVKVSGFSREELVGAPHNLVRHPHMPKEAFRDLWTTVKAGRPWEGLVKNRAKSGAFYWVRANVTPVMENGELTGFISIRTRPDRADVAAAETVYAAIREKRARGLRVVGGVVVRTGLVARGRKLMNGITSGMAIVLGIIVAAVSASLLAGMAGVSAGPRSLGLLAVGIGVVSTSMLSMRRMRRSFQRIEAQFGALARGDLQQIIEPVSVVELQVISGFLRTLRAKLAYAEEVRAQREADAAAKRVAAIKEMADRVESTANQTSEEVSVATREMAAGATVMSEAAGSASQNAEVASHAASEALSSAQTVAATTEELAASIREITNRITHASTVTREAVDESDAAKRTIAQLNTEVERIGHITSLIAEIASQTNLLALNATIEAARAGDAGKGFAVVAAEVKKLAAQTGKATGDISGQITEIQRATTDTVEAVTRIGGKVGEIDQVSAAIAAAMEQQSAATQEIARSVSSAAAAAQTVTEMMDQVVSLASTTKDRSGQLCSDAESVAQSTSQSRHTLIKAVRTSVEEAERRMHHRFPADEAAELVIAGARNAGRLTDLSEGGARVRIEGSWSAPVAASGTLVVTRYGLSVPCRVTDTGEGSVGLAFASPIQLPPTIAARQPRAA